MIRVSEPYQFDVDPEPPFRNSGSGSSGSGGGPCGGSETPCNIARYYLMIVHCMISVLFLVYKLAYFGIHLTNTVSVFSA